jgi:hypothetical protein
MIVQGDIMLNPFSYLGALFQEPTPEQPLDARIAKTFTKWPAHRCFKSTIVQINERNLDHKGLLEEGV